MQVINAALILIFIPIFDKCVYPLCGEINRPPYANIRSLSLTHVYVKPASAS